MDRGLWEPMGGNLSRDDVSGGQMSDKPRIRVVAAEVERDGRYLITQRRPEARFPLLWEFPSGRVEPGETDEQALAREFEERLGAKVSVREEVLEIEREYDKYVIDFHVYRCVLLSERLSPVRVNDFRWVTVAELADYEFPPADQASLDILMEDS